MTEADRNHLLSEIRAIHLTTHELIRQTSTPIIINPEPILRSMTWR